MSHRSEPRRHRSAALAARTRTAWVRQTLGAAALAAVAALVLSGCGSQPVGSRAAAPSAVGSPSATVPFPGDPSTGPSGPDASAEASRGPTRSTDGSDLAAVVQQAATATQAEGSSRIELQTRVEVAGQAQTITGEGLLDFAADVGRLTVHLGDLGTVEQIITADAVYLRMPETGEQWLRAPLGAFGADVLGGTEPSDLLATLDQLGDVQTEGTDVLDGVATTRYVATLDLAAALARSGLTGEDVDRLGAALDAAGPVAATVTVWVDDAGRVVRTTQRLAVDLGGLGAVRSTSTLRLFDFGVAVDVTPPPPDQVVDAPEGLFDGSGPPAAGEQDGPAADDPTVDEAGVDPDVEAGAEA